MSIALKSVALSILALAIIGCSDPSSPRPAAPYASRAFDPKRPGVQITRIYYDENANQREGGSLNEYIVLQATDTIVMDKWKIKTSKNGYTWLKRLTVPRMLTIYTRPEPGLSTPLAASLDLSMWLWRDDHDTVWLYNDQNYIMSVLWY